MRQTRLSIGCQDWQKIVRTVGPEAAGVLVYLRTIMRSMQASEITITLSELAETLRIPSDRAETALAAISPRYLERTDAGGVITLRSPEEAKAAAERRRKQAAKIATKCLSGNSGKALETPKNEVKSYHTDYFMCYDGSSEQKEKEPHTPQKEKSLTESIGRAPIRTREREPELPADHLEAEFIETIGFWPKSLREALKAEPEDVREAFYLYIRCKTQDGEKMTADRVRIAWLAARRVPPERRAESILAAAMGGWKTIRDAGSGCYFEKSSGRIVSLVRGPVESKAQNETEKSNAELAVRLARSMRRG